MRHLAILVVLALTLVGCGGSDGDAGTATTVATTTTAPAGNGDATTTSQPTTTTSGSESDDEISFDTCPELMAWTNDFMMANSAALGGSDATGLEYTAEYFQEFADRAPAEIRDDMQVIADAFSGFFAALDELDVDFTDPESMATVTPAQIEQLEAAVAIMDTEAVERAGDNINAYFERECS